MIKYNFGYHLMIKESYSQQFYLFFFIYRYPFMKHWCVSLFILGNAIYFNQYYKHIFVIWGLLRKEDGDA